MISISPSFTISRWSIILLIILLPLKLYAQHPIINEVQYVNKHTWVDNDGNTPDWIELYNPNNQNILLKGYLINDEREIESAWTFPDTILAPHQYMVLYASGVDKQTESEIHLPFRLKQLKDSIFLFSPQKQLVDVMEARCVPPDKTIGRKPDGNGNKVILTPTPGYSNNSAHEIMVNYQPDSIWLNLASGFYTNDISIEAKHLYPKNTIRYTLDADEPDWDETEYTTPIRLENVNGNENRFADYKEAEYKPGNRISKANVLRIQVFSEGCPASDELVETYFIDEQAPSWQKHVPVVSLVTDKDNLFNKEHGIYVRGNYNNAFQRGKAWERPVHIEVFDTTLKRILNQHAGLRIHGNGSRAAMQKNFRLYARNKYGKSSFQYPYFEQKPQLESFQTLLLRGVRDWSGSMFKDELCQHLVDGLNFDYAASQTVVAFVNGEYWGVYSLREHFDDHYIENNHKLAKPDLDVVNYSFAVNVDEGTKDNYEELRNFIINTPAESDEFYAYANEKVDLPAFIDFYAAQFYLANKDFPRNNVEFWMDKTTGSKWRPNFYDLDATFTTGMANQVMADFLSPVTALKHHPLFSTEIMSGLLQNPTIRTQFHTRFLHLLQSELSTSRVYKMIDQYYQLYLPLVNDHTYRWGQPTDIAKWTENVDALRSFAVTRPVQMQQQLTEALGNPFTIYPNPSNGTFQIDFDLQSYTAEVCIYSMQGVRLHQQTIMPATDWHINLNVPVGLYLVKIHQNNVWYTDKILINHLP